MQHTPMWYVRAMQDANQQSSVACLVNPCVVVSEETHRYDCSGFWVEGKMHMAGGQASLAPVTPMPLPALQLPHITTKELHKTMNAGVPWNHVQLHATRANRATMPTIGCCVQQMLGPHPSELLVTTLREPRQIISACVTVIDSPTRGGPFIVTCRPCSSALSHREPLPIDLA